MFSFFARNTIEPIQIALSNSDDAIVKIIVIEVYSKVKIDFTANKPLYTGIK